jgi:hypothetical protein
MTALVWRKGESLLALAALRDEIPKSGAGGAGRPAVRRRKKLLRP